MSAMTPITMPGFLCHEKTDAAAAKAHAEWVDGQEKLDGRDTKSATVSSMWQGRGRAIKSFNPY